MDSGSGSQAKGLIPIGTEITIDNRRFSVDSVDAVAKEVSLRDLSFQGNAGFPVFRIEKIDFVKELINTTSSQTETHFEIEEKAVINNNITSSQVGTQQQNYGGDKTKYKNNVNAIRIMQALESEQRPATAEEHAAMRMYTGWGGIPQAFDSRRKGWKKESAELKELLTDKEYQQARRTTLNAHYTPLPVIREIYFAMESIGFHGGRILEPAMAIGNFFNALPEHWQKELYGVELDSVSGRIAKQLHPNANIQITGYQDTLFPDGFFDAAIGNVPFGNY